MTVTNPMQAARDALAILAALITLNDLSQTGSLNRGNKLSTITGIEGRCRSILAWASEARGQEMVQGNDNSKGRSA